MDDKLASARDAMMELRRRVNTAYESTMLSLDGYSQRRMYAEALRLLGGLDSFAYVRGMIDECMADKTFFRMAGIDVDAPKRTPPAQPAPKGPVWRKMTEPPKPHTPVLCVNKDTGAGFVVKWYPDSEEWAMSHDGTNFVVTPGDRWTALPRPEVGE